MSKLRLSGLTELSVFIEILI